MPSWIRSFFEKPRRETFEPGEAAAGIPETGRFHDLRHSPASLMIAAGIHLKVIQERLGHSTFQLTADTYSHLLQGAQADAAERVGELVGPLIGPQGEPEAAATS